MVRQSCSVYRESSHLKQIHVLPKPPNSCREWADQSQKLLNVLTLCLIQQESLNYFLLQYNLKMTLLSWRSTLSKVNKDPCWTQTEGTVRTWTCFSSQELWPPPRRYHVMRTAQWFTCLCLNTEKGAARSQRTGFTADIHVMAKHLIRGKVNSPRKSDLWKAIPFHGNCASSHPSGYFLHCVSPAFIFLFLNVPHFSLGIPSLPNPVILIWP